jgi:predicted transcriptional regulator of viral defense system
MAHGVYRVPQVAETPYDLLALAVLWTGAHEAALSHETALAAWGGSDINPERINVSVAKNRRIKRAGGEQYVIQHEDIDPIHITWWQQIPIVDVPTAIEQCIEDGTPSYLIQQSIDAHRGTSRLSKAAAKALAAKLRKRDHD